MVGEQRVVVPFTDPTIKTSSFTIYSTLVSLIIASIAEYQIVRMS